jgi:putative MATE family efflux protein
MLGANVLQTLNGSINAVWVGRFLGEVGLAATSNANLIMFMVFILVFGFGMAATILIGQYAGQKNIDGVRRAIGAGAGLFLSTGIVVAILGWLFAPQLLHAMGTPPQAYPSALGYLRIMFAGLPPGLLTLLLGMALRGTGDSMTPLLFMLPGALIDVVLNPVLILGLGPFPAMGINGAATASLIANYFSLTLLLSYIYRRDLPIRLRGAEFRYLKPDAEIVRTMVTKGIPMGLQMIIVGGSTLAMMTLVNPLGTDTVAAYGAVNQLWTYVQMPAFAIGSAISTMAAQNIGAGKWDRVDAVARAGLAANLMVSGGIVVVMLLTDKYTLSLFLGNHDATIAMGRHINLLAGWGFVFFGLSGVFGAVPRANGATMWPLINLFVAMVIGRVGAANLLRPWLGTDAIWWSFPLGSVIAVVMTYIYFRYGGWRELKMISPRPMPAEAVLS